MTVHSHFSSTRFSSLAPMPTAEKPATSNNAAVTPQAPESMTEAQPPSAQPSLPSGLVGHHVNTTA